MTWLISHNFLYTWKSCLENYLELTEIALGYYYLHVSSIPIMYVSYYVVVLASYHREVSAWNNSVGLRRSKLYMVLTLAPLPSAACINGSRLVIPSTSSNASG